MQNYTDPVGSFIKNKRQNMGLSLTEFAILLDMNTNGERTVRGWENGEHKPTPAKLKKIELLKDNPPFRYDPEVQQEFTFIDLFAGIGGIRIPFQELGGKCVFSSESDKFAQKTYAANFGEVPSGDITQIQSVDINNGNSFDILLAGFPCQAFSQAGLKKGFNDTRGTMFFEIQRILSEKRPKAFLLENVKQLKSHDKGNTLRIIQNILQGNFAEDIPTDIELSKETRNALCNKLNYWIDVKILRAADFGIPQNRERIFIVGFDKNQYPNIDFDTLFTWPTPPKTPTLIQDILEQDIIDSLTTEKDTFTISDKLWLGHQERKKNHKKKGNGFGYTAYHGNESYTNTLSARYYKDGSEILIYQNKQNKNPRKLTPRECARLQGFPEEFIVNAVSQNQIYKQFGNAVCVEVIRNIARKMRETMILAEENFQ